jgi:2-polyprenyl-3-methyl-5-hydroxy-6-metoxy-1,4-benzoquinol methylase
MSWRTGSQGQRRSALDRPEEGAGSLPAPHADRRDAPAGEREFLCPACSRTTAHRFLYAKNGCEILQCRDCDLGRAETPTGFDPSRYYTGDYFEGGHFDGYPDYAGTEQVLRREFARTVEFIRKYRPRGRLLDVGCAYGFFLQEAKPYFDVSGIELAEDAAAHARRSGLNVLTGVADEASLARLGAMDVIVLLDVIEHLSSPRDTLALCARHLNPGGIIVITTGDFGSPYARLAGAHWRLMTPPQHLWFFSRESIRRMAASVALEVERFDHPWKIVPLSLITFQLGRMLGRRAAGAPAASRVGLPVNLFDAMRIVLRKPAAEPPS